MITIFTSGERTRSRKLLGTLTVVMAVTLGLSACNDTNSGQIANAALRLQQAAQSEEKLQAEMQSLRSESRNGDWNALLGETLLYVPDDYKTRLTSDRDTFMGAVIGTFLNSNPQITYDDIDGVIGTNAYCGSGCQRSGGNATRRDINREEMEFYKLWSDVWLETVMQSEEATEMKELYALFQKRIGNYGPFNFVDIRALLKDEQAFVQFINDDDYARDWMLARASNLSGSSVMGQHYGGPTQYENILRGQIPQITIPVLPNTAS